MNRLPRQKLPRISKKSFDKEAFIKLAKEIRKILLKEEQEAREHEYWGYKKC